MTESSERQIVGAEVPRVVAARLNGTLRDDGAKVALVIEGGGMRGIVSAAMATALEESGILPAVDIVVGTSAGAVNAAATVRGTISGLTDAYADVYSSREFIDIRRLWNRGRPVVDSARIVSHIDQLFGVGDLVGDFGPRLAMVATDIDAARAEALTGFADRTDQLSAIHASGLLPILGGPPISFRGRRWLDGGILEPVPVAAAATLGATHAIVLATRPRGFGPTFGAFDRVIQRYLHGLNPTLGSAYAQRPARYRAVLEATAGGSCSGVRTVLFAPDAAVRLPGRLERDAQLLRSTGRTVRDETLRQLATWQVAA
ncbi:patatin-like phospholipase family protein [Aeromicrobium erythreum]|uniref:patatin-like phospholipase family protein n=1 Tax=Aeromicrobium erythreum TaxID=2041 RepID=UPI00082A45CC|nr:patatin-like phospholipase family protein [Aeromicrobium erythreum]